MPTLYTSNDGNITITIRQQDARRIAWACFVRGAYIRTKVLPRNNTAIVQNFGFAASDFTAA